MIQFMAGALFTLVLVACSLLLAFKVSAYKEEETERREQKKKRVLPSPFSGGVVRPLTPEQRANKKDEVTQAFNDLLL